MHVHRFGLALGILGVAVFVPGIALAGDGDKSISDAEIKKRIIAESIASYPGRCPCPYNLARNGSRCGRRSAWSRQGGYAPICYEDEITRKMIQKWRRAH